MNIETRKRDIEAWISPPDQSAQKDPGYEESLAADIAEGLADVAAGRVTPAEDVWKELGIE